MDEYQNFINAKKLEDIEAYLQIGADINYKAQNDVTLLSNAISDKDLIKIRFLIEHGANPNSCLGDVTYLMLATVVKNDVWELNRYTDKTQENEIECKNTIQLLLGLGANLEFKNSKGDTVLMNTIMRGDLIMSKFLITLGANYDNIDWEYNDLDFLIIKSSLKEFIDEIELNKKLNHELKDVKIKKELKL